MPKKITTLYYRNFCIEYCLKEITAQSFENHFVFHGNCKET